MKGSYLLVAAILLMVGGCHASASQGTMPGTPSSSSLIGAWRLIETQAYNQEGEKVYDPEVQTGLFLFTDAHYSIMWTREPRPPAVQHWKATDEERLASFNTLIAHAGRYTKTDTTLHVFAEAAKSPEFVGGTEVFSYRIEGDTLLLTAQDAESVEGIHVAFYEAGGRQEYWLLRVAPEE
ncbi:MAG TPA: lipocalin-like domain-containing protein [Rhodothermales bacterium]|nr:lipocalin-like domain-containing protein [Rhodothermales bacterium]